MFIAWEHNPKYSQIEGVWYPAFRISILSPIREGSISFYYAVFADSSFVSSYVNNWGSMQDWFSRQVVTQKLDYSPSSCGVSEWAQYITFFGRYPMNEVWVFVAPLSSSGTPPPPPMYAKMGDRSSLAYYPAAGLLGVPPPLDLQIIEAYAKAKPGSTFDLPAYLSLGKVGGSSIVKILGSLKEFSLNPSEISNMTMQFTMPALWPGEKASIPASAEIKICDIRSLFSTDEARAQIEKVLEALNLSGVIKNLSIEPIEAILVDTKGRIDILGDLGKDVNYKGVIVKEGKLPEIISGKSPDTITFTEKLLYAKIEVDRSLAIAENGKLLSNDSNLYEYSPFPLPWRAVQAVSVMGYNLRPTLSDKGLVLPRFMVKSRIKKGEVVGV